jgi:hypothetical protein
MHLIESINRGKLIIKQILNANQSFKTSTTKIVI